MPDTGLRRSPKFQQGALVQLVKDLVGVVPNVIPFQYNPEKLSRSLTPWNPFETDQTQRGAQAPTVGRAQRETRDRRAPPARPRQATN